MQLHKQIVGQYLKRMKKKKSEPEVSKFRTKYLYVLCKQLRLSKKIAYFLVIFLGGYIGAEKQIQKKQDFLYTYVCLQQSAVKCSKPRRDF